MPKVADKLVMRELDIEEEALWLPPDLSERERIGFKLVIGGGWS